MKAASIAMATVGRGALALYALAGFGMSACSTHPLVPENAAASRGWVLDGAGELSGPQPALPDVASLFEISSEMRQFATDAIATAKNDPDKIRLLVDAMHSDTGLGLRYDASATLTPTEAFAQRRANCMTHTLLFIALARDIGIDARFNQVDIPPIWDLRGNNLVLYKHINARVGASARIFHIVDLTPEEYDPNYHQWVVSDTEAAAQFFSNRAVDLQTQNQGREALHYQLRALQLAPQESFLWSNLGHLYLSIGNARAAEIAIQQALHLDPDSLSAYGTASRIYEALGQPERARIYRREAENLQKRNPYYHYQLAQRAYARHQLPRALEETKTAISLYPEDHRFLLLLGAVLNQLKQPELARKSIEAAIAMTADAPTQARYRSKLDRIAMAAKQPG
ncbi:tetratricopeptide repeat protein [Hydrocarboniphaga sp.]|uniref:tetratricopeptide repeat protein n=1 Tax=Hydrocarboniphaga sp. TaxID=2033016 RepID=UPI003D148267